MHPRKIGRAAWVKKLTKEFGPLEVSQYGATYLYHAERITDKTFGLPVHVASWEEGEGWYVK